MYTCNSGAGYLYGQCDGGLCFDSTRGKTFPFFEKLHDNEIICSCPIANSTQVGFQIFGPALGNGDDNFDSTVHCDRKFKQEYCDVTSSSTGTMTAVGAITGGIELFAKILESQPINRC
jgi:hypothetical protein